MKQITPRWLVHFSRTLQFSGTPDFPSCVLCILCRNCVREPSYCHNQLLTPTFTPPCTCWPIPTHWPVCLQSQPSRWLLIFSVNGHISFKGCLAQIFLLHFFGGSELVILIATAFDRYVAICKPLRYTTIMRQMYVLALWLLHGELASTFSVSQLAFCSELPFCGPNEVDSFYRDLPRVIKLACTDTHRLDIMVIANSGVLTVCSFFLLIISYTVIFSDHPASPFREVIQGSVYFNCSYHSSLCSSDHVSSFMLWPFPIVIR